MIGVVQALLLGALVGLIFALARLLPPAPQAWAGVAGIVGIVAGWQLTTYGLDRWWTS